jgi:hypothetical protein
LATWGVDWEPLDVELVDVELVDDAALAPAVAPVDSVGGGSGASME